MGELKETHVVGQEKVENLQQAIEEMSVSQEKKEHVHESKVQNSAATKEMMENRVPAFGWAARDSSGVLAPFKISRRATGEKDVKIKVLYCGICRSDLHSIKNEWGYLTFPLMPGHEIVGEAIEVGSKVTQYKVGDKVGVGCIVGTCSTCDLCKTGKENYCPGMILTYGGIDRDGTKTDGGYSNFLVVDEDFVLRIPENLPLHAVAPLLCGGITCYSPMRYFGLDKPGLHLGVVGLGGLGHIAVKFAKAMGLKVTVISTSPAKKEGAIENLGVDAFLHSEDTEKLEAAMGTMDGIIDTSPYPHKVPTVGLLKSHGKLIWVGLPKPSMQLEIPIRLVALERKIVTGSIFGPIKETQEMLDYAGNHEITADVEVIPMDYVNKAMERLAVADVRYRFVIDVANTLKEE